MTIKPVLRIRIRWGRKILASWIRIKINWILSTAINYQLIIFNKIFDLQFLFFLFILFKIYLILDSISECLRDQGTRGTHGRVDSVKTCQILVLF